MPRHTGSVSHIDEETGYAEIAVAGMQPIAAELAELRRCRADALGVTVDFEHGVLPGGNSGAVRLSRPGKAR